MAEYLSMTTYIPSKVIDEVCCQAMGVMGCRYSIAYKRADGKTYYSGVNGVKQAKNMFDNDKDISRLVVYLYHPTKKSFEHIKTFM